MDAKKRLINNPICFSIKLFFRSRFFKSLLCCILLVTIFWEFALAQEKKWILNSDVLQGSSSSELRIVLDNVDVQRLLIDIALKQRTIEYVTKSLNKTNISIEQLLSLKLIRKIKQL